MESATEYRSLLDALHYATHELPVGILGCADCEELQCCEALLRQLRRFEVPSAELGLDNAAFGAGCAWHFERYPHYLSRCQHFGSYREYIVKYQGPLNVLAPAA